MDHGLRKMTDVVGIAVVGLEESDKDRTLAALGARVRAPRPSVATEFCLDEGYLTTSSTGSERLSKSQYFTP